MNSRAPEIDVTVELLRLLNTEISLDPSEEVFADTDLLRTGLVDSLGVVQIVNWIEDRLGHRDRTRRRRTGELPNGRVDDRVPDRRTP